MKRKSKITNRVKYLVKVSFKSGRYTLKELADKYGISESSVSTILSKKLKAKQMCGIAILLVLISSLLGCEKEDLPRYEHKDYALIFVYKDDEMVAAVGALPGDTVRMGNYTVVYQKRK